MKIDPFLSFTCPTRLSGICIVYCIMCYILVSIISYVHHALSRRSKEKVSEVFKFLLKLKLYFNRLQADHNRLHKCLKLVEKSLVSV